MLSDGSYSVLVIEDDHSWRDHIEAHLRQAGRLNFQITNAESLEAGIREAYRNRFSVLLVDLNLQDSKGLTTLERLRREVPGTPIVVLTGSSNPEELKQARALGASSVLEKTADLQRDLARELVLASETYRTQTAITHRIEELQRKRGEGR